MQGSHARSLKTALAFTRLMDCQRSVLAPLRNRVRLFQRESDRAFTSRLRRRPGDRTALGAEAAHGLTSDHKVQENLKVSIVSSVPARPDFGLQRRLGDRTTIRMPKLSVDLDQEFQCCPGVSYHPKCAC
jgi:hypothetical protein